MGAAAVTAVVGRVVLTPGCPDAGPWVPALTTALLSVPKVFRALMAGGRLAAAGGREDSKSRAATASCLPRGPTLQVGDDLLSRFRSTIGAAGFNFSVRDG